MSDDYLDFEFRVTRSDDPELPAYVSDRNPYVGRAFRSAIEAAYGVIPRATSLEQAFAVIKDMIVKAAKKKVIAVEGEIDQPVPVIRPDICD